MSNPANGQRLMLELVQEWIHTLSIWSRVPSCFSTRTLEKCLTVSVPKIFKCFNFILNQLKRNMEVENIDHLR